MSLTLMDVSFIFTILARSLWDTNIHYNKRCIQNCIYEPVIKEM